MLLIILKKLKVLVCNSASQTIRSEERVFCFAFKKYHLNYLICIFS